MKPLPQVEVLNQEREVGGTPRQPGARLMRLLRKSSPLQGEKVEAGLDGSEDVDMMEPAQAVLGLGVEREGQ